MLIPPFLQPGDTVMIVAPASPFPYTDLQDAFRVMRQDWQLTIREGTYLTAQSGAFAGTDAQRLADLQQAINDPAVRAIFAARGGYGSYRLVEQLDLTPLLAQPKWLVGFSDITVLLAHAQQQGVASLHAIMPRQFRLSGTADDIETLRQWLFGEVTPLRRGGLNPYMAEAHPLNRPGVGSGTLAGGNLSMLVHTLGTSSEVDWAGKILFIEDIDETLFSIDRMMTQLRRASKLEQLAGLLVGNFADIRDNQTNQMGKTAAELIAEAVSAYTYPVAYEWPVGHEGRNLALPVGLPGTLTVSENGSELVFA
ncbi:muramoyltetrapeptide carboxypeptidase [Fibrella aestuarina BUZ 2]|uniref:Muramoyltetrapeptide carboxypeptidase n=1 Tax=Fibrella aestuarina BUZ 2 TaxID=1166018 RepID=I0KBP9_9BACT|nr:LD-carboxypeptidase [Fibrella aestuarina]CCH01552.1 muramoyltetrapeptide carboxypeptidase [Fibrella aestuarina BUZ 2]